MLPGRVRRLWQPPERMTAAEWVPRWVRLPAIVAAIPGRWSADLFPYCTGVLDAWCDPYIEQIALEWASQLGKTTLIACLALYVADQDPGPMLLASSVQSSVKELVSLRLYPMLEACDRTRDLLPPKHLQDDYLVSLTTMLIYTGWSGSATRMGEKSIRYVMMTELDKWAIRASLEADPEHLAGERRKAFPNFKILKESTPTIEGLSRIHSAYQASDRRRFHVPCPKCGAYQVLDRANVW